MKLTRLLTILTASAVTSIALAVVAGAMSALCACLAEGEAMDHWLDLIPAELKTSVWGMVMTFMAAWVGRLAFHVEQVRRQRRKFWSIHLVWETVTAVAIGFVADGVAAYFGFEGPVRTGAVVAIAYLGPRGIESLVIRIAASRQPGSGA